MGLTLWGKEDIFFYWHWPNRHEFEPMYVLLSEPWNFLSEEMGSASIQQVLSPVRSATIWALEKVPKYPQCPDRGAGKRVTRSCPYYCSPPTYDAIFWCHPLCWLSHDIHGVMISLSPPNDPDEVGHYYPHF